MPTIILDNHWALTRLSNEQIWTRKRQTSGTLLWSIYPFIECLKSKFSQNLWQSISAKLNVERTQGSGDPAAQTGRYCSPRLGLSRCPSPNKTQNVIGSFIQSQVISLTNIQQAKHGFAWSALLDQLAFLSLSQGFTYLCINSCQEQISP